MPLTESCGFGKLRDFGMGGGAGFESPMPLRDFEGFFFLTSPAFSLLSSLFAKKLAVFAKVLRSSTACSSVLDPADFSIMSMRRRISSRSSEQPHLTGPY